MKVTIVYKDKIEEYTCASVNKGYCDTLVLVDEVNEVNRMFNMKDIIRVDVEYGEEE